VGKDYPQVIGNGYAGGYRLHRISEVLNGRSQLGEADMLALQLDTLTDFYQYYHWLAKNSAEEIRDKDSPQWQEIRDTLANWNGHADRDSRGLALLRRFRERLMSAVLGPLTRPCRQRDPAFVYRWNFADQPLQALLTEQPAALAPLIAPKSGWKGLIAEQLAGAAADLKKRYRTDLRELRWGRTNRWSVAHPISEAISWLSPLLNMPEREIPGCGMCVRVYYAGEAASERLVVAPSHERDGIFHMPGGQSGNPFSAHYGDQQAAWVEGIAAPLLSGPTVHTLTLNPRPNSRSTDK
jgi:penicillin amidase